MKSEPLECSIHDALAAPGHTVPWVGVRNYQARNFMRDQMRIGDGVLFYHSSCEVPGIYGLAEVASGAYPDATQFDPASPYFDAKSSQKEPRWLHVDVRARSACELLSLTQMRDNPALADLIVLQKGSRLSITPVESKHWKVIKNLLKPLK